MIPDGLNNAHFRVRRQDKRSWTRQSDWVRWLTIATAFGKGQHDAQFDDGLGLAREDPSLGRRRNHPRPAHPWLVDDAYHSAAGAPRELRLALDLLALLILQLLWRWLNPSPELPAMPRWEQIAARVSHAGLYVLMVLVSLTGWMVATTFRVPMTKDLLGIDVPPIVTTVDRSVRQWIEESHMVLAYLLAAVVLIHIVAALRHHMLKRNDVLRRMIWSTRA
jgi:cytochrome b561